MNDYLFIDIPKVIETPKNKEEKDYDAINLNKLRALLHKP